MFQSLLPGPVQPAKYGTCIASRRFAARQPAPYWQFERYSVIAVSYFAVVPNTFAER